MKSTWRKKTALLLIITIVCSFCSPLSAVFAASYPVNIFVESYENGELVLYWNKLPSTASISVQYHYPDVDGKALTKHFISNQTENKVAIHSLGNDIIYDFDIKIFDKEDAGGNEIGKGLLFFIPYMTFYADVHTQQRYEVEGGGYETGITPGFNLKWMMPVVYNGSSFAYANEALPYMEQRINGVYNDSRSIDALNFRVNISTDSSRLDSGSSQSAVVIETDDQGYTANVSGHTSSAKVHDIGSNSFLNFDIIGRKDEETSLPEQENVFQLMHPDILPGTVYYMNIKPNFLNEQGRAVNAVTVGSPNDQNGSKLSGPFAYAYTPIRFQLTKDNQNNIYAKIYKINQGSLDLPRLYYQIQSSDDPSIQAEWPVLKDLDDTYFNGDYAITVISGVSPNNEIFYKVVAKTDARQDRLQSPIMEYTLKDDTTRPPVPRGVEVTGHKIHTGSVTNNETGEQLEIKSSDVVLEWEKPDNWDTVKNNLYFHILLNTNQFVSDEDVGLFIGDVFLGAYPTDYRLVKYISGQSPNIKDMGNRLRYTINGLELFNWEDENGIVHDIPNDEGYPDFLIPNTAYYIKLYTTDNENRGSREPTATSDYSLTTSFTTLPQVEHEVPLPDNFKVYENAFNEDGNNVIKLQFEGPGKSHINWSRYTSFTHEDDNIYYDLYMSSRPDSDSFIKISSTEDKENSIFNINHGEDREYITAIIKDFEPGSRPYTAFGESIRPNSTYYFVLRTRIVLSNQENHLQSQATSILSVTTLRGDIKEPDESAKKPLTPTDFSVKEDENGDLMISSTSVAFSWSKLENNVRYRVICSAIPIKHDSDLSEIANDPIYSSFIKYYSNRDSDGNNDIFILDPKNDLEPEFFEYDAKKAMFYLNIDEWLHPNRLYYFSIKTVDENSESIWVTIPVTTKLIDMPQSLEAVNSYELGFNWTYDEVNYSAEDFNIFIRKHGEGSFNQLNRSECSIVKDGSRYYGRVFGLNDNTPYDVRVYVGESLIFSQGKIKTRNGYKELEVKWQGSESYDYQISVRTEKDNDYIILDDEDFIQYKEKSSLVVDKFDIHALIKSVNGETLLTNTKYFIRVRAVKKDPDTYSKYTQPVYSRTNFDQDDYDDIEDDLEKEVNFLDRIDKLEEEPYWRIDANNTKDCKILFKKDRVINIITNLESASYVIDLYEISGQLEEFIVFIPLDVVKSLKDNMKSLVVKGLDAEYVLRPGWLTENSNEVKSVQDNRHTNDIYIMLKFSKALSNADILPEEGTQVLAVAGIDISIYGVRDTIESLEGTIYNKLYNKKTGLVGEKLETLLDTNIDPGTVTWNKYIEGTVELIKTELSIYINTLIDKGIVGKALTMENFAEAISIRLRKGSLDVVRPYAKYLGTSKWASSLAYTINDSYLDVDTIKPGKYISMTVASVDKMSEGAYSNAVLRLSAKYDLLKVFNNIYVDAFATNNVTETEMILLYQLVTDNGYATTGMTPAQKAVKMGIDKWIKPASYVQYLSRDKLAAILTNLFCTKTGANMDLLRVNSGTKFNDEKSIEDKYYKPVMFILSNNVLTTHYDGTFRAKQKVTREELFVSLLRILELSGEVT